MKKIALFIAILGFASNGHAGLLFNYSQLALKDLDQMVKIVREKVRESNKSGGDKTIPLKEALQAVLSRPNEDDMVEKIISPLKSALDEQDAWESSIQHLVKEAVGALKNTKAFKPVTQVTYAIFLENLMAELKPRMDRDFEKSIFAEIKKAKIEITQEAKHERVLRMMKETKSPSVIAEDLLLQIQTLEKSKAKEGSQKELPKEDSVTDKK